MQPWWAKTYTNLGFSLHACVCVYVYTYVYEYVE